MFASSSNVSSSIAVRQVRNYATKKGPASSRITSMRSDMRAFMGPRNFKGFNVKNPFFFPPKNKTTNYISRYQIRGGHRTPRGVDWDRVFKDGASSSRLNPMVPFAENPYTQTAKVVSVPMKRDILEDINVNNMSAQEASFKYGLSVPRIEAIVELATIREKWVEQVSYFHFTFEK